MFFFSLQFQNIRTIYFCMRICFQAIERDLFDSEASEEGESGDEKKKKPKHREVERPLEHPGVPDDDEEEEESDDDNMNNFLVDDDMVTKFFPAT